MRRLAAKRQREAPPERSGKLLTNVGPAAGRGEGSAAAQHQMGPGPSSLARPGSGPRPLGPHRGTAPHGAFPSSLLCLCLGFPTGCTPMAGDARLGWAPRGVQGAPGERPAGAGTSPAALAAGPAQTRIYPPPRHSPGAGCAGCVEPGVPSPGPAPLCRHTGHPESPPARQRRARSCGDTRELHPEISETDTIPPERSLGSSDTCLPGFGCGRKCPNIPWSPALWRLLPWLSHGSQAPEVLLL